MTKNPYPYGDAYYTAKILVMQDRKRYANTARRCTAERDLAVAALRRIHEKEIGIGDADMIAAGALSLIEPEPTGGDAETDYHAAAAYLSELNAAERKA